MGGRSSRNKGRAFEQKVARDLREIFPDAKRGFQTRGGGAEEPDVKGTPFHIECKAHKKVDRYKALVQASSDVDRLGTRRATAEIPVAVCKDDRQRPVVRMYLNDLADLRFPGSRHSLSLVHAEVDYEDWLAMLRDKYGRARERLAPMTKRANGTGTVEYHRGKWRVRVVKLGKRVTLGTFATKEKAERVLRAWLDDVAEGVVVDPNTLTFAQFGEDWIELRELNGSRARAEVADIANERRLWNREEVSRG